MANREQPIQAATRDFKSGKYASIQQQLKRTESRDQPFAIGLRVEQTRVALTNTSSN